MISFNPGPSKVYPQVKTYLNDAFDLGVLSMPHRSDEFSTLYRDIRLLLSQKLDAPDDYFLYFFSSATECWSVLAESAVRKSSLHIFSGDFGEKWYNYSYPLNSVVARIELEHDQMPDVEDFTSERLKGYEIVCLTHNETSNGARLTDAFMAEVRDHAPDALIAVDVTSSLGGVTLPWASADVWFASVQKCLGLPAGLAIMLCSPRTVERFELINFNKQYNSLINTHKNALKFQTTHTPNVLGIYLLCRVLHDLKPIAELDKQVCERAATLYHFFEQSKVLRPFVPMRDIRSFTVLALTAPAEALSRIHQIGKEHGLYLGQGYGWYRNMNLRIANFPQHTDAEFEELLHFMRDVLPEKL